MLKNLLRLLLTPALATLLLDHIYSFDLGPIQATPNKLLTVPLLLVAFFYWVTKGFAFPRHPKNAWIVAFYVALFLGTAYSAASGLPLMGLFNRWTTFLSLGLFYFIIGASLDTRREYDLAVWSLVLGVTAGALSEMLGFVVSEEVSHVGTRWDRGEGIAGGANKTAGHIAICLALAYAMLTTSRSFVVRGTIHGLMAALVLGFFSLLSRSGTLAVLAMGGMWFIRFGRIQSLHYVLGFIVLLAVGVLTAPDQYFERVSTIFEIGDPTSATAGSDLGRLSLYAHGLRTFVTHPLLGVGAANFKNWTIQNYPTMEGGTLHNMFGQIAVELGIIGLVPFVAIVYLSWRDFGESARAIRRSGHRDEPELRALWARAVFGQIGFLGILVVGQFQPAAYWKASWLMFAMSTVLRNLVARRLEEVATEGPARAPTRAYDPLGALPMPHGSGPPLAPQR